MRNCPAARRRGVMRLTRSRVEWMMLLMAEMNAAFDACARACDAASAASATATAVAERRLQRAMDAVEQVPAEWWCRAAGPAPLAGMVSSFARHAVLLS